MADQQESAAVSHLIDRLRNAGINPYPSVRLSEEGLQPREIDQEQLPQRPLPQDNRLPQEGRLPNRMVRPVHPGQPEAIHADERRYPEIAHASERLQRNMQHLSRELLGQHHDFNQRVAQGYLDMQYLWGQMIDGIADVSEFNRVLDLRLNQQDLSQNQRELLLNLNPRSVYANGLLSMLDNDLARNGNRSLDPEVRQRLQQQIISALRMVPPTLGVVEQIGLNQSPGPDAALSPQDPWDNRHADLGWNVRVPQPDPQGRGQTVPAPVHRPGIPRNPQQPGGRFGVAGELAKIGRDAAVGVVGFAADAWKNRKKTVSPEVTIVNDQAWPSIEAPAPFSSEESYYVNIEGTINHLQTALHESPKVVELLKYDPKGAFSEMKRIVMTTPDLQEEYESLRELVRQELITDELGLSCFAELQAYVPDGVDQLLDRIIDPLLFFFQSGLLPDESVPVALVKDMGEAKQKIEVAVNGRGSMYTAWMEKNSPTAAGKRLGRWFDKQILHTPYYQTGQQGELTRFPYVPVDVVTRMLPATSGDFPTLAPALSERVLIGKTARVKFEEQQNRLGGLMGDIVYTDASKGFPTGQEEAASRVIAEADAGFFGVFFDTKQKAQDVTREVYRRIKGPSFDVASAKKMLNTAARAVRKGGDRKHKFCAVKTVSLQLTEMGTDVQRAARTERAIFAQRQDRMQGYHLDAAGTLQPIFPNALIKHDLGAGKLSPKDASGIELLLAEATTDMEIWTTMLDNARTNLEDVGQEAQLLERLDRMKHQLHLPLTPEQQSRLDGLSGEQREDAKRQLLEVEKKSRVILAQEELKVIEAQVHQANGKFLTGKILPNLTPSQRELLTAVMDEHVLRLPDYVKAQRHGTKGREQMVVPAQKGDIVIIAPSEIPPASIQQAIREVQNAGEEDIHVALLALQKNFRYPVQLAAMRLN